MRGEAARGRMRGKTMISRRRLLRVCTLPLVYAPLLSACGSDPRDEDVAQLIRDGDFDAARTKAEALMQRGAAGEQIPLLAGALALQAGDFTRARELFAAKPGPGADTSQAFFASGLEQSHWLRLAALRSGIDVGPRLTDAVPLDPLGAALAGRISAQAFLRAKIEEARRIADATILSIRQSPGRDDLLDRLAGEGEARFRCTGNFVAAERSLASGDEVSARAFLTAALQGRTVDLLEFHIARAELARLS